jgi:membrane protease YdiL (CAAX protease family)
MLRVPPVTEPRSHWQPRAFAIIEVAVASLLTPVLWQGFKRFTALGHTEVAAGFNFSAGVVTILTALCLFLWHRKSFADFGVSLRNWPDQLKTGVVLTLMLMFIGLLTRSLFAHHHGNFQAYYGTWQSPFLYDIAVAVIIIALFPWILRFVQGILVMLPTALALMILLGLWSMPLGVAYYRHQPLIHTFFIVFGFIVTTGFAEEFFYWGYIQPRLNEVLGRPYDFGGIPFGLGLVITCLLFGFIHTLNGVDFLHGHFNLNWGWGLVAFIAGLGHGLLRERTGSILAGTVFHGINDIWAIVVIPMILG